MLTEIYHLSVIGRLFTGRPVHVMEIDPENGVTRIEPLSSNRIPTRVPSLIPAATATGAGRRRPREFPHLQIAVMIDPFKVYSQCI